MNDCLAWKESTFFVAKILTRSSLHAWSLCDRLCISSHSINKKKNIVTNFFNFQPFLMFSFSLTECDYLLVDKEGNLRLTGFGAGRFEGSANPKFQSSGNAALPPNVRWMAPEVLKDDYHSKHSDVW